MPELSDVETVTSPAPPVVASIALMPAVPVPSERLPTLAVRASDPPVAVAVPMSIAPAVPVTLPPAVTVPPVSILAPTLSVAFVPAVSV